MEAKIDTSENILKLKIKTKQNKTSLEVTKIELLPFLHYFLSQVKCHDINRYTECYNIESRDTNAMT